MLNRVPQAVRTGVRAMVMRNPNALDCRALRKVISRTAGTEAGNVGGLPTLGGMTVMSNDDEPQVDYQPLGQGKVLFTGQFQPAKLGDGRDFPEQADLGEAMVEPLQLDGWELRDGDLLLVSPGGDVLIPYEVTRVITSLAIPPYVQRVELAAQGDPMFDADLAALQADRD